MKKIIKRELSVSFVSKRRFLLVLTALLSFAAAQAYELGDYVYTPTAKFKVIGENLVQNGNFANAIGNEWLTTAAGSYNPEYWSVENVDGVTCLRSTSAAEADDNSLFQAVPVEYGKNYVITLRMKAGEEGPFSTVATLGAANCLNVFANVDGSANTSADGFTAIAGGEPVGAEWTDIAFSFANDVEALMEMGFVNIVLGRLPVGTLVTDIEVREVVEVYDTRKAERVLNYAKELIQIPDFEEGAQMTGKMDNYESAKAEYEGMIEELELALSDPTTAEDVTIMEAEVAALDEAQDAFLNGCAADMKETTGDWANLPYNKNAKSFTTYGYWILDGGRGFSRDASRGEDGYGYVAASIGGASSWDLDMTIRMTDNGKATKLPAGKYFFSIETKAFNYMNKNGSYDSDFSVPQVGPTIFVGKDTVKLENDTIPGRYWKTYYMIAEIAEDEDVTVGFTFPTIKRGGEMRARRAQVRLIGKDAETAAREASVAAFIIQQNALRDRLAAVPGELANENYPWGKAPVQEAADQQQPVYDESLTYVDADGNDLGTATKETLDAWGGNDGVLMTAVRAMQNAFNTYHNTNTAFVNLKNAVENTRAAIADEGYNNADKTAINAAIASAQALLDAAPNKSEADAQEYVDMQAALKEALVVFQYANVSARNPVDLVVDDATFANGLNGQDENGWVFTGSTYGKIRSDIVALDGGTYDDGRCWSVSRNNPANTWEAAKAMHRIPVNRKGCYELRMKVHANTWGENVWDKMIITEEVTDPETGDVTTDSLRNENGSFYRLSGVRAWFGDENTVNPTDSVDIANYVDITNDQRFSQMPEHLYTISLFFEKNDDVEQNLEFGVDGTYIGVPTAYLGKLNKSYSDGAAFGLYGFGSVHVYYYANKAQYVENRTGVEAIKEQTVSAGRRGIYTLNGVKVSNMNQKGIYIINGRKVIR